MEHPSSRCAPSYPLNKRFVPGSANSFHPFFHLQDEEATCMPARLAETLPLKKKTACPRFAASLFALLFFLAASSFAQTTAHSPGWAVLPVDEYRTLHSRAYPVERDPEPPPLEAPSTPLDYDLPTATHL